jgi:hypothetical protein
LYDVDVFSLGGTNNVQGRQMNGVAGDAACDTEAVTASERFVHLEQDLDVREEPQHIIDALLETLAILDGPPPTPTPAALTAQIFDEPAPSNSRHRRWRIEFNQEVDDAFRSANLLNAGSLAGDALVAHRTSGTLVLVLAAPLSDTTSGTLGFDLVGPIAGPFGEPFTGPLASSLQAIAYYPPGDVTKDGTFDVSDVLALSNAATGLLVLP